MNALLYDGELRLIDNYAASVPAGGEALVRTTLAGICATDLEIVRGYAGFQGVLGHEFVGIIEEAEDPALIGRRVVGDINVPCGRCDTCRNGRPTHCPARTALGIRGRDGTLAEFFTLPAENLHFVPAHLADEEAVFAEPLAAACQIPQDVHVRPTDCVIVLGDGKLGLLVAQVLAASGCDLTVLGRHPENLGILESLSISTQLGGSRLNQGADIVVDCTGQPQGFAEACRLVRPRGTIVLKSTYSVRVDADLSSLVVNEVHLVGSRCGPMPAALRLLALGFVEVEPLIEATYPLSAGLEAFVHAGRGSALKVLVRP